jgi:hypothetical protein
MSMHMSPGSTTTADENLDLSVVCRQSQALSLIGARLSGNQRYNIEVDLVPKEKIFVSETDSFNTCNVLSVHL